MARIGLINVDSKIPNVALARLYAYHKRQGDEVVYPYQSGAVDKIYASAIFTLSRPEIERLRILYPAITIGGSGVDAYNRLPDEVQQMYPALHEMYGIDYGLGKTSSGCVRKCSFCIVPIKEGALKPTEGGIDAVVNWAIPEGEYPTTDEVVSLAKGGSLEPRSNRLILCDNNLLGDPEVIEKLEDIADRKMRVNFNQGLDIRLVTPDIARRLRAVRFENFHGTYHQMHFAWDFVGIERALRRGFECLVDAGIKPWQIMFYVLVGFNSTFDEDMYRFEALRTLGCEAYIMVYRDFTHGRLGVKGDGSPQDPRLRHFARWVNAHVYKSCTWEEYEPWKATSKKREVDEQQMRLFFDEAGEWQVNVS